MEMNGFLLINKPKDWTSRDICNKISHILHYKKVGHIGTLDPFATGLLIVMIGNATKTSSLFDDFSKTYEANLVFGKQTNTGDVMGEVIKEKPVINLTKEVCESAVKSFIGTYSQLPPMTSAIHVNGVKLYQLAHQGIEVEREPRNVTIYDAKVLDFNGNSLTFEANVSKGTYIRTLGEDIAKRTNNVGYLGSLNRTSIGPITLSNEHVINIEEVSEDKIIPISDLITFIPTLELAGPVINKVKSGVTLSLNNAHQAEKVLLVDQDKNALAIYGKINGNLYKCLRGLWS